jgi:uncharacterized membrane protein HdeD (DUF308 family)
MWAIAIRPMEGWLWVLLSGALGVALSVLLLLTIDTTASWLLALLVGVQLISIGASLFYLAWTVRKAAKA